MEQRQGNLPGAGRKREGRNGWMDGWLGGREGGSRKERKVNLCTEVQE
jgi:hypothetical protein